MTDNKYWIYLENLRKSGITNMFGASPYLADAFGLERKDAQRILADWMRNYDPADYDIIVPDPCSGCDRLYDCDNMGEYMSCKKLEKMV